MNAEHHFYPAVIGCHRIHHGLIGMGMLIVGAALVLTDWRDYKAWLPDLIRYS